MAFGFPPHFGDSRTFYLQHGELVSLVKATLDDLKWKYKVVSRSEVLARTPFLYLGSLGERLKIEILPDRVVAVDSRNLFHSPGFDAGRNKERVKRFFIELEHKERMYRLVATPLEPPAAFDAGGLSPVERALQDSESEKGPSLH